MIGGPVFFPAVGAMAIYQNHCSRVANPQWAVDILMP